MARKYEEPKAGEWVRPVKRGYLMQCCDCALVHTIDFDHIPCGRGRKVIFRVERNEQETRQQRRKRNIRIYVGVQGEGTEMKEVNRIILSDDTPRMAKQFTVEFEKDINVRDFVRALCESDHIPDEFTFATNKDKA